MWLVYIILLSQAIVTLTLNSTRCKFSDECYPSQKDMADLDRNLTGTLYLPHMDEYKKYVLAFNTYEQRYPALIAMVKSASDIQSAILWARKYNLHVTIRSSGHCYLGRSTWDGSFNINLAWMKDIEIKITSDRSTYGEVKVQTGLTWLDIYKEVDKYKRVVVGGSAHTGSPGGYTLGGGHSPVSRSFGYAVDNVLEFQMVLANGDIATCTEEQCNITRTDNTVHYDTSGDLFWAVRGGGGGTYGVVVYFVYKLHPDTKMAHAHGSFPLAFKIPQKDVDWNITDYVLGAMLATLKDLPKEWGGYMILENTFRESNYNKRQAKVQVHGNLHINMIKFAPLNRTAENKVFSRFIQIEKNLKHGFLKFEDRTDFLDYIIHTKELPIDRTVRTTLFSVLLQNGSFNESFKNYIKKEMYETYRKPEAMACFLNLLGGKTKEFPVDSTPLSKGYRTAHASFKCGAQLDIVNVNESNYFDAPLHDPYLIKKVEKSALELRQYGEGMYFNEATKNNPNWRSDFWNDYPRLLAIKKRYDPDNFFTCHQCVGAEETEPADKSRGLSAISLVLLIFAILFFYIYSLFRIFRNF